MLPAVGKLGLPRGGSGRPPETCVPRVLVDYGGHIENGSQVPLRCALKNMARRGTKPSSRAFICGLARPRFDVALPPRGCEWLLAIG